MQLNLPVLHLYLALNKLLHEKDTLYCPVFCLCVFAVCA